jgi:protein phosphatase PTC2/3
VSTEKLRELVNNVGTTACVVLITDEEIFCANAGDSRAILTQGLSSYDLSDDHKPENDDETLRICAAGGNVVAGRVNEKLAVSRAIGDLAYKTKPELGPEKQIITCVPDVTRRPRSLKDSFLVIACDGVWDCYSS